MSRLEDCLAQAERHVREAEERVARQTALVAELDKAGDADMADLAQKVQAILERSLERARDNWAWSARS